MAFSKSCSTQERFGSLSKVIVSLPGIEREGEIWNERVANGMMKNRKSQLASKSCACEGGNIASDVSISIVLLLVELTFGHISQ